MLAPEPDMTQGSTVGSFTLHWKPHETHKTEVRKIMFSLKIVVFLGFHDFFECSPTTSNPKAWHSLHYSWVSRLSRSHVPLWNQILGPFEPFWTVLKRRKKPQVSLRNKKPKSWLWALMPQWVTDRKAGPNPGRPKMGQTIGFFSNPLKIHLNSP